MGRRLVRACEPTMEFAVINFVAVERLRQRNQRKKEAKSNNTTEPTPDPL